MANQFLAVQRFSVQNGKSWGDTFTKLFNLKPELKEVVFLNCDLHNDKDQKIEAAIKAIKDIDSERGHDMSEKYEAMKVEFNTLEGLRNEIRGQLQHTVIEGPIEFKIDDKGNFKEDYLTRKGNKFDLNQRFKDWTMPTGHQVHKKYDYINGNFNKSVHGVPVLSKSRNEQLNVVLKICENLKPNDKKQLDDFIEALKKLEDKQHALWKEYKRIIAFQKAFREQRSIWAQFIIGSRKTPYSPLLTFAQQTEKEEMEKKKEEEHKQMVLDTYREKKVKCKTVGCINNLKKLFITQYGANEAKLI